MGSFGGLQMDYVEAVAEMIVNSKKVVVFTGAGFSTESDIPDFRGTNGIWTKFDPDELNLPNFLQREDIREKYWQVHRLFWEAVKDARPNKGHYAVTELHTMGKLDCVITQNTDGLHQKSGTPDARVLELHGTMHWVDCLDCRKRYPGTTPMKKCSPGRKCLAVAVVTASSSRPRSPTGNRCRRGRPAKRV